MEVYQKLFI